MADLVKEECFVVYYKNKPVTRAYKTKGTANRQMQRELANYWGSKNPDDYEVVKYTPEKSREGNTFEL